MYKHVYLIIFVLIFASLGYAQDSCAFCIASEKVWCTNLPDTPYSTHTDGLCVEDKDSCSTAKPYGHEECECEPESINDILKNRWPWKSGPPNYYRVHTYPFSTWQIMKQNEILLDCAETTTIDGYNKCRKERGSLLHHSSKYALGKVLSLPESTWEQGRALYKNYWDRLNYVNYTIGCKEITLTHTVKAGETAWDIWLNSRSIVPESYKMSWLEFKNLNSDKDLAHIIPGDVLKIAASVAKVITDEDVDEVKESDDVVSNLGGLDFQLGEVNAKKFLQDIDRALRQNLNKQGPVIRFIVLPADSKSAAIEIAEGILKEEDSPSIVTVISTEENLTVLLHKGTDLEKQELVELADTVVKDTSSYIKTDIEEFETLSGKDLWRKTVSSIIAISVEVLFKPIEQITCSEIPKSFREGYNKYSKTIEEAVIGKFSGVEEPRALMAGLISQESAWDPNVVSKCGSAGIVQFIPSTGRGFDLFVPQYAYDDGSCCNGIKVSDCNRCTPEKCDKANDERFDPIKSIPASATYLSGEIERCGSIRGGLGGYNGGMSCVEANAGYTNKVMEYYELFKKCFKKVL